MSAIDSGGEPPRHATSSRQIYAELRQRIVTGALPPTHCLSETELAASLGVSRTPVREALGKLEAEELIEIRPRFGTFVSPIRPDTIVGSQFVREAVECTAIAAAATHCTPERQRELEAILAQQQQAPDDESFFRAGDEFHCALMTMAGQPAAWTVIQAAKSVMDRVRFLSIHCLPHRQTVLADHRQITERVVANDPAGAAQAMRGHLRAVFASAEHSMAANPEFFAWDQRGPRPKRHRSRQASAPARAAELTG